jgi:metallo-beta-lactamase family protein
VGNVLAPIVCDTEILPANLDALVCESTYGGHLHEGGDRRTEIVGSMITEGLRRGGVLMIPSFAIERTQELIYELNELIDRKHKIPNVPIFLDSPMAIGASQVYRKYPEYYDDEASKIFKSGDDLFDFPSLTMCETRDDSKKINQTRSPKVIIAGAGMMNGGRILHHAIRYLSDERNSLLIVGYQAEGTLGRQLLNGEKVVQVMGERIHVKCHIQSVSALSAHADQAKLMSWIGGEGNLPKKIYLNHGEPESSEALEKKLKADFGAKVTIVDFGLTVKV